MSRLSELITKAKQRELLQGMPEQVKAAQATTKQNNNQTKKKKSSEAATNKAVAVAKKKDIKARKFAVAWLLHNCNSTEAYLSISPKCSRGSAGTEGCELLASKAVQTYLATLIKQLHDDQKLDVDYILGKLISHSTATPIDYLLTNDEDTLTLKTLTELSPELQQNLRTLDVTTTRTTTGSGEDAEESITQKIKLGTVDQQKAVDSLAKIAGLLRDKIDVQHTFVAADQIERGVARMRELGSTSVGNLYDEQGNMIEDPA